MHWPVPWSFSSRARQETRSRAILALVELLSGGDPAVQPDVLACLGEAGPHAHVALPALEKLPDDPELDLLSIIIEDTPAEMPNQADAR